MPYYIDNNIITFNGPASVADQFSNIINLTGVERPQTMAWFWTMSITGAGVWAVTLQFNPDPYGASTFGWQDEARSSLTVLNTLTCATLSQTNASIDSSKTRGGIVTATGSYNLLFPFQPSPYYYRLRFQITSALTGTIPKISISTGT